MTFIVVVLLLTLVGAGTGFTVGSIMQPEAGSAKPASKTAEKSVDGKDKPAGHLAASDAHGNEDTGDSPKASGDEPETIDPQSLKVTAFPPVLTTLAQPKGRWIRLEGSILTAPDATDPPELLADRSGEQILTYLRSLRLDQIEGPSNVLALREDLAEMLRVLSREQVKGILINGLVVE